MSHRSYYWIFAYDESSKPYLVYGGATEDEARQKGLEILGGLDFQIKCFPTKNLREASSFLRGKILESSHSLREAGRRIGHTKSINRLKRRKPKAVTQPIW